MEQPAAAPGQGLMVDAQGRWPLPWLEPWFERACRIQGHALLLHGPSGVGQLQLALTLAQAWLCESVQAAGRACGRCASCHLMRAGAHPDFRALMPAATRIELGWDEEGDVDDSGKRAKPSRDIRIEEVRQAIAWGQQTSSRGRAKVIVLHPAHALNAHSANSLLKTLEEPPGALRIILCAADPGSLMPTLRSRCQALALSRPTAQAVMPWLKEQGVAPTEAEVLLKACGGQPLLAQTLLAQGLSAGQWQQLPRRVLAGDASALGDWPLPRAVDALQKLCLDLMLVASGAEPQYFPADSLKGLHDEPLRSRAQSGSGKSEQRVDRPALLPALAAWSASLWQAARHAEHPWNAGLKIEALVLQCRACAAAGLHAA